MKIVQNLPVIYASYGDVQPEGHMQPPELLVVPPACMHGLVPEFADAVEFMSLSEFCESTTRCHCLMI